MNQRKQGYILKNVDSTKKSVWA